MAVNPTIQLAEVPNVVRLVRTGRHVIWQYEVGTRRELDFATEQQAEYYFKYSVQGENWIVTR